MSTLTTEQLKEMIAGAPPSVCDCTLSHNGIGRSGRECDCFMERFDISPTTIKAMAEEMLAAREREQRAKYVGETDLEVARQLQAQIVTLTLRAETAEANKKAAVLAEREATLQLCDELANGHDFGVTEGSMARCARALAAAIRARQGDET